MVLYFAIENKNGTRNRLEIAHKLSIESIFANNLRLIADCKIENYNFDLAI